MSAAAALQAQTAKAHPSNSYSLLVQRKCACGGSRGLIGSCSECEKKKLLGHPLQTKLRVNEPGDEYEKEADRVADQVMRMPEPVRGGGVAEPPMVPLVQRRGVSGSSAGFTTAPPIVHDVLSSPGQPLDAVTRGVFESRFNHDFGNVRVHTDGKAALSAAAVDAQAYTVGHDIVFGARHYSPTTTAGQRLLAHELVHVHQQAAGAIEQIQRSLTQTGPFAPASDQAVQAHIDAALAAHGNDLRAAWQDLQRQRCLPQNCLDVNLAAAEHYMFARYAVEDLLIPVTSVEESILAYSLFKRILMAKGIEVPSVCSCPATPPSDFQVRWGLTGVADGSASPRASLSAEDVGLAAMGR